MPQNPPHSADLSQTTGVIADNIIGFARALRAAGLPVGPGATIDALKALQVVGLGNRADVFTALEDGAVGGMDADLDLIATNKYYEVTDFVTQDVNLWPFPAAVVINKAAWDKLSSDQQAILRTAAKNLKTASLRFASGMPLFWVWLKALPSPRGCRVPARPSPWHCF